MSTIVRKCCGKIKTALIRLPTAVSEYGQYKKEFGSKMAKNEFLDQLCTRRVGYSNRFIQAASEYMIRELHPVIERYSNDAFVLRTGKFDFQGKRPIWICWWQGKEHMPPIVEVCVQRIRKAFDDEQFQVVLLSSDNYRDYIDIPQTVMNKFHDGKIAMPAFSDILRWGLMASYGGVWMDATVYLTYESHREIASELEMPFFTQRFQSEAECPNEPCRGKWCNFYFMGKHMQSVRIFQFVYDSILFYWENHDMPIHYVWLDYILWAAYTQLADIRETIDNVPANNENIWKLLLNLNGEYSDSTWKKIMADNEFYKTTYKENWMLRTPEGKPTMYAHLLGET